MWGTRVVTEVREELYAHLLRLSLSYHTRARSGDLLTRLIGDIGRLQEVAVTALLPLLVHLLTFVGMIAVMIWIHPQLAAVSLLTFPLVSLSMVRLSGRIRDVAKKQRRREGAMAATAAESLNAIRVVHAFSLEPSLRELFGAQNKKNVRESVKGARLAARMERTVDVLLAASTALVLGYGARLVLRGALTPGDLLVFMAYLKSAFKPMRDLAKYTGRIAKATAAGDRVLDVLDAEPEVQDRPAAVPAPAFGEGCASRGSPSPTRRATRCWMASRSRCAPAPQWPWSAPLAAASPRWPACCCGCTSPSAGESWWTGTISAITRWPACAPRSAWCSRKACSSP